MNPQVQDPKVMRLCLGCAELARSRREEERVKGRDVLAESDPLTVKTSEGETPLSQIAYDFAVHLTSQGVGWGRCDLCKRPQLPNMRGPLHEGRHAPLVYVQGEPKDLRRLYSIAARVLVAGEWKEYIEQVRAYSVEDAKREWRSQFAGKGNFKPHIIDACGPTLGFIVDEEADKDGKVLIA